MSTRNIVPRSNGEGNIGTSVKNWLSGFFQTINILGAMICTQIATPSNPSSGANKLYFKSDGKLYKLNSSGTETEVGAGTVVTVSATFTNASLSTGKLTITHNKALSAPYQIIVQIFDNNNKVIIPDEITGATNSVEVDLTSYGTLTGTWGYIYMV